MEIRDIAIADIRAGKNWRLVPPDHDSWLESPMEEWGQLIQADQFTAEDRVVYSALRVYASGRVEAIVLIKTVGDLDYGGDNCELIDGKWRQVGLAPNPNVEISREFIANPLTMDESFSADDYREEHR